MEAAFTNHGPAQPTNLVPVSKIDGLARLHWPSGFYISGNLQSVLKQWLTLTLISGIHNSAAVARDAGMVSLSFTGRDIVNA